MSKGSTRRPGDIKPGAWEAIFGKPAPADSNHACRNDGRCQYAIDHGAEGLGACPTGNCCMPAVNVTDWSAS